MELKTEKEYSQQDLYDMFKNGYAYGLQDPVRDKYGGLLQHFDLKLKELSTGKQLAYTTDILRLSAMYFNVPLRLVENKKTRKQEVMTAVKYASYLCYWFTNDSTHVIAAHFGRDHSNILHHLKDLTGLCAVDKYYRESVLSLLAFINIEGYWLSKTRRSNHKYEFPKWIIL